MPNFMGNWFPWNDVEELEDIYHTSMLALLTLWTDIGNLKTNDQTFKHAFNTFIRRADECTRDIVANIQYQHECSDSVLKKRAEEQEPSDPIHVIEDTGDTPIPIGAKSTDEPPKGHRA
jgi:hypothetical protein